MTIAKANRINIVNPVYAVITKDDLTGFETGSVKSFGDAMQVQITPTLATGVLYGNGAQKENLAKLTGLTVVIDVNKVPIDVRTEIMGHDYTDGVATVSKDDQPKDIALGYKVEQTNGKAEYVWLLKGKPQPWAQTVQQSTENINFSTDSLTINFVPREFDGNLYFFADSADSEFTGAATWFESVPGTVAEPPSET